MKYEYMPRWFSMRLFEKEGLHLQFVVSPVGSEWLVKSVLEATPLYRAAVRLYEKPFTHLTGVSTTVPFGFDGACFAQNNRRGAYVCLPLMRPEVGNQVSQTLSVMRLLTADPPTFPRHGKYSLSQTVTFSAIAGDGPQGRNIAGELTPYGARCLRALSQEKRDGIAARATEVCRRVWNMRTESTQKLLDEIKKNHGTDVEAEDRDYFDKQPSKITDKWFDFSCPGTVLAYSRDASFDGSMRFCGHNMDSWNQQLACLAGLAVLSEELDKVRL